MGDLFRRLARRLIKPGLYRAIDAVFPHGLPRRINGEPIRLSMHASRFYPASYEPEKAKFLRRHCLPATTAIDIGAHFGVFTVIMARAVGPEGRVLSLEPTPSTRATLGRTVVDNGCEAVVTIRPEAVCARDGHSLLLTSPHRGDMGNGLVAQGSGAPGRIEVPTTRLDSLVDEGPVSCIKIDAEGAELDILRGAGATLHRHHPAITMEVHPQLLRQAGQDLRELWSLLVSNRYRLLRDGLELSEAEFLAEDDYFEVQALADLSGWGRAVL